MGSLTLKALVKQIDALADSWLPLAQPLDPQIVSWAEVHGWDASDTTSQRLLVRQALLNEVMRRAIPGIADKAFATPLDSLTVEPSIFLVDVIREASQAAAFNFWGALYNALIPQSRRRQIGQFWTDQQIADWMVAWLLQYHPRCLADIGCGTGNFLLSASRRLKHAGDFTRLYGCDISPLLLNAALANFLTDAAGQLPLPVLEVQDYLEAAIPPDADAVVCNPPYTRHHHIGPELKDALQACLKMRLRQDVSRQGTLAFYFLLKLIAEMPAGAHAAVIVPMEVLDARYGRTAKRVLCQQTTLAAVIHFSPRMNAFHKVDVGASILLFEKGYKRQNQVRHLMLDRMPATGELLQWLNAEQTREHPPFGSLVIQPQDDLLDVPKWFSISASGVSNADRQNSGLVVPLRALARVMRGIATGANEFFVLSTQKVKQFSLEPYVVRTVQRNREIQDIILDEAHWQALSEAGKPVWLLYLNNDVSHCPELQTYLTEGERKGYHHRSLVQTRKKWYIMEQRDIPAIFFTILTRGNPRFILNQAGVRPLNMFLLIYPNKYVTEADATDLLWVLLNSNFSLSRLHSVSRTYGGNTLKVEPRELDNLPVVNPLALSNEIRREVKRWIADFYRHRQASVLMCQVNRLVEQLVFEGIGTLPSRLPIQLRLLDAGGRYDAKAPSWPESRGDK